MKILGMSKRMGSQAALGARNEDAAKKEEISRQPNLPEMDIDIERMPTNQENGTQFHFSPEELERLGRERPPAFRSVWIEVGFCFSLLGSSFAVEYFTSGFNTLLPTLATELEIPSQAQTWPASVPSLVTSALLLPMGRLADIIGGYFVFLSGLVWFLVWSFIAGFSQNYLMLVLCRALQGLGPAAFLSSGIMLLGSTYRPGPRKNLVFSLYGAFAPVGFFAGIFFAGISANYLSWRWYFWIGSIIIAIVAFVSYFAITSDYESKKSQDVEMDWLGTVTIVPALILIVFALTDGAHAPKGWATPYIPITFVLGCILLGTFVYIEGWVAKNPLLPADMFQVKGMKPLVVALLFQYGVFGIFLFYASLYIEEILHASPLLTAAWFAPMCVGGIILASGGGLVLHLFPGSILLLMSGICYIFSVLLFAVLPENPNYWAYVFPAMLCATLGVDVSYNVTNIFITTSMPRARQGLAGALVNSLLFLGISLFLGFADLAVSQTADQGQRRSYKVAFWFAVGLAGFGVIVMLFGVKIGKAKSELTIEEKAELERELVRRESHK